MNGEEAARRAAAALRAKSWRLATAESCTGGMVGMLLTSVPGVSAVYAGGVIAYANAVKEALLEVPEAVLKNHGAVSRECAEAMARGAAARLQTDCAVSTTGIAGPDGGSAEKPVGMVCFGIYADGRSWSETDYFHGSRAEIRAGAAVRALELLYEKLMA